MKSRISAGWVLAFCILAAAGRAVGDEHRFVGVRKCGTCHSKQRIGNQVGVWKRNAHAKAFQTLNSERAVEVARAAGLETPPQESEECLRCHVTGYGLPAALFPHGRVFLKEGVGCESCHGAGGSYRKKKIMSDEALAKAKGLVIPTEERCRDCHNEESPTWDPDRTAGKDGKRVGFDFETARRRIAHPIPSDVKGHYVEILKREKGR